MYVQCTCARPEKLQTAKLAKPLLAIATEHHRCGAESSSLAQVTETCESVEERESERPIKRQSAPKRKQMHIVK